MNLRLFFIILTLVSSLSLTAQENEKTAESSDIMFAYTSNLFKNFGIGIDKSLKGKIRVYDTDLNTYLEFTTGFLKELHIDERYKRPDLPDSIHKRFDYNVNRMSLGIGYGVEQSIYPDDPIGIGLLASLVYFDGRYRISKQNVLRLNPDYTGSNAVEDLKFKKIEGSLILSLRATIKKRIFFSWGLGALMGQYLTKNNKIADYKLFDLTYSQMTARTRIGFVF